MCARTYAREGRLLVFSQFYFPFFHLHFSTSFIPPPLRSKKRAVISHKTTRCFSQNDTLFLSKRHVVSLKTTRCFSQNDTLFFTKRHVVSHKTTRCFSQNKPLFSIKQAVDYTPQNGIIRDKYVSPPPISPNNILKVGV